MGMSYQDAVRCGIGHLWPAAPARPMEVVVPPAVSRHVDDGMNKTERRLSVALGEMLRNGRILAWDFEPEKFRMADRTWWTPDFRVTLSTHQNVFLEVKAMTRHGKILWKDDAAVKAKAVAEREPYAFFIAAYQAGGGWTVKRLPSRKWNSIDVNIEWWF